MNNSTLDSSSDDERIELGAGDDYRAPVSKSKSRRKPKSKNIEEDGALSPGNEAASKGFTKWTPDEVVQ